jgi:hypothetical protein
VSGPADGDHHAEVVDPVDGTRWSVDLDFLASTWRCRWGDGCPGILDQPAPELEQGCCSVGAELLDEDEARAIAALGMTLDPERFQFHAEAVVGGVVERPGGGPSPSSSDDGAVEAGLAASGPRTASTRVVEGACIFLNRPGFAGGAGCALHLAAVDEGESPIDWKPSVCWQLPLKAEEVAGGKVLRRWRRDDWGPGGRTMAWCCTEAAEPSAYDGAQPVIESLADEVVALVGPEVAVAIRGRVAERRRG